MCLVKCPACGFESPEGAQWCDFCKEPFNKKPKPAPAPAVASPPLKLPPPPLPSASQDVAAGIPPEFAGLDTGGKIPVAPPWFKYAGLALLGIWILCMVWMAGFYMAKANSPAAKTSN